LVRTVVGVADFPAGGQGQILGADCIRHVQRGETLRRACRIEIDHDLAVSAARRRRKGDAVDRRQPLPQIIEPVIELLPLRVSELRLICSTGTLEALYSTTSALIHLHQQRM
jgi:hypothetical protein